MGYLSTTGARAELSRPSDGGIETFGRRTGLGPGVPIV
jgi:hypothetical protein